MKLRLGILFTIALALVVLTIPAEAQDAGGYVGSEICADCHEGYDEGLARTPHGKQGFANLSSHGCETCHGPGEKHLEDPEAYRPKVTDLSKGEQAAMCQSCHDGAKQFFWQGSAHDSRGLSCLDCHAVHSYESEEAQLKQPTLREQCYTCHKDIRAQTWKRSHHPIREGRIDCADCHNPHGAQADKMVNASSINEQCYSCHTEKRGPFLWDHAPVRENCTSCHTPHGSNHLKLQKTSVPFICQQCHSNTRHPGTLYDFTRLADQPAAANREFNRACLNCHSAIHGSNHPSGWALMR